MNRDLSFRVSQRGKAFSRSRNLGSHSDKGQREYGRSVDRSKAVGGKTSTAFSFSLTPALPVKFRVLLVIPPLPDHTCQQGKHYHAKSLRGMPANYRIANSDEVEEKHNRHSMGDWERSLLTDTRALGKRHTSASKRRRGVAVARDRQTEEKREQAWLFKKVCERCGKREAYWSATWCSECIWEFVRE